MDWIKNPFSELYPTEKINGDDFVGLFSSKLINSATNLYGKGNTILEGVQGSGKSMLLALLKPEIRLAYSSQGIPFPVPAEFSNFFSAGINLTQDGAKSFSNLRPGRRVRPWQNDLALYFADYINFIIIKDILKTLSLYRGKTPDQLFGLYVDTSQEKLDRFAISISKNDCWFDYMNGVNNYQDFIERIDQRIKDYRFLLSQNISTPPESISKSKTQISQPVFELALELKEIGILDKSAEFIVYIDQYEELDHMCRGEDDILIDFRRIINQALHYRDDRVSFKIGTRGYAWKHNTDVYSSYAKIEEGRDFDIIKIYDLLRRREHTGNALFKLLCEEVFNKRLIRSGIEIPVATDDIMLYIFGKTPSPREKSKIYAGNKPERTIKWDKNWPKEWSEFLNSLSKTNPLSAHLGAAWCRQQGKGEIVFNIPEGGLPWESDEKRWWKKERLQQSLVQMASNKGESLLFYGVDDIIGGSGANILSFLTICQKIWSIYITSFTRSQVSMDQLPHNINRNIQSAGIKEASRSWFEKISELSGGDQRKDFIGSLGRYISSSYLSDLAMSYPGNTGISLPSKELNQRPELKRLLDDCVDYSILDKKDHTTKGSKRNPRVKFYLEPILCPFFKLPFQQTKEPMYLKCNDITSITDNKLNLTNNYKQLGFDI